MNSRQRGHRVALYGEAFVRSRERAKKRVDRLRRRIRSGGPIYWDGIKPRRFARARSQRRRRRGGDLH